MDDKKTKSKKEDKVEELEKKLQDLEDQLKRSVADYRNFEKRIEDEKIEMVKFANRELLFKLLPAFDTLFLAHKYVTDEGLKLSIQKLIEALKDSGVERIETERKEFDPYLMECVDTGEGEENKVTEEVGPGFTLFGKVLRPAQVKVGKSKIEKKETEEAKEELLKGNYM